MTNTVGTCECGAPLISTHVWEKLTTQQRHGMWAAGYAEHQGRGLCAACRWRHQKAGTFIDVPTRVVPIGDVLDAWHNDGHRATDTEYARIRNLAPRLGMTVPALERAIARAKRRGLLRSNAA